MLGMARKYTTGVYYRQPFCGIAPTGLLVAPNRFVM